MLEAVSEFAILYLKTGACFGFGWGALAQCFPISQDWKLKHSLILTVGWVPLTVMLIMSYRDEQ